jgi:hypothetical protein
MRGEGGKKWKQEFEAKDGIPKQNTPSCRLVIL